MEEKKKTISMEQGGTAQESICTNPNCTCDPCTCEPPCTCGMTEEQARITKLEAELAETKKLADEHLNLAKYARAEFENFRKRERANYDGAINEGKIFIIMHVLGIIDNLAEAIKIMQNETDRDGVKMIHRKLLGTLESLGLEEIRALGEKFDPNMHNCIARGKFANRAPDEVAKVWQTGYKFAGKVIRPTTVTIAE